ncbi:unnamed protein product [Cyclocybe aegerita]|uniref:F-box domain-containing protein n=1 Tax=Cyclocybe aegerita TaxID=1973307 RepID=A0A8S0VY79_CYCAE|nr:unnamed protein product [Cyclocybe aegerita]
MSSSFPSLPQELLIEIMTHLDSRSILQMALACHTFYGVFQSTAIRYVYELGMNSMRDAGSGKSIDELLVLLRGRQRAWAALEWKKCTMVKIPPGYRYKQSAGILAAQAENDILVIYLPSSTQPSCTIRNPIGTHWIQDFAIDANQDLIILAEYTGLRDERHIGLHCRTISTNEVHPNASQGGILEFEIHDHKHRERRLFSMKVSLADNVVALCGSWREGLNHLLLWNWTTGLLLFNSFEDVLPRRSMNLNLEFDFLRQDAFLLASPSLSGQILIYRFSPTTPGIPVHVASFGLPSTAPLAGVSYIRVKSGQFQPRPTPGMLFMHLPESRMHTFFINYHREAYLLFVWGSTFLRYVDETGISEAEDVPWETWGERESRFMEVNTVGANYLNIHRSDAVNAHGSRVVHGFFNRRSIEVLDFSSTRPCLASPLCMRYGSDNPTIVPRTNKNSKRIFSQDVVTRLPYRSVLRVMVGESHTYMIDEERIISLDVGLLLHFFLPPAY